MTISQLEKHIADTCDMREFPTKKSLYTQSNVLQQQIEDNEPHYETEITSFKARI
eukprot:CAMPEP_0185597626 /NCGR_PEP_ID=MMETSP0434-20130131/81481_1 /TAXON_ID=626734 ORGANISM="Favella taraikaensis, Strain Fe Narragansett Bay" /NCGR_SAMPLE_ID=MMETSP0434 /ASSEMBLY_ACC=CAM_ASM_000379 /LENGTH=54 /DNA_ID=CAMNT_0028226391 /DNA_START=32 /DNA_END=196 /DNA_ORIENTATION=-